MLDLGDSLVLDIRRQDDKLGTLDADISLRIDQMNAVHSRSCALVELPRKVLHGDVFGSRQVTFV